MLISFGNVVFVTGTNAEPTLERLVLILVAALVIEGSSMDTALYVERMSLSMTPEWVLFFFIEPSTFFIFSFMARNFSGEELSMLRDDVHGLLARRSLRRHGQERDKRANCYKLLSQPGGWLLKIVEITHAHTNARNMNFRLSFKQVINSNSNMFQQQLNGPNVFLKI